MDVRLKSGDTEPARDFMKALKWPGIRIIAEVKKASPSAGVIRPDFDPLQIAQIYEENGAACLSILTDEHFFQGKLAYLENVKTHVKIPCLRKDFTLEEYNVYEARAHGADAVLLIARILEDSQLKDYGDLARELGMTALVEVHDEAELERAKKIGAGLIGINNRNLDTFTVDLETTVRLSKNVPEGAWIVSESGISTPDHIRQLGDAGVRVFLIGEAFMKCDDPGQALRSLLRV